MLKWEGRSAFGGGAIGFLGEGRSFSLLDWIGDAGETFEKSVGTIQRWMSEIIGYFDYGTTSGAVEGINNRLKLIKRLGYGFRNFENFSLRCLICWHLDIGSA
jgi:transposase